MTATTPIDRPPLTDRDWLIELAKTLDTAERTGSPLPGGIEGGRWIRISDEAARDIADRLGEIASNMVSA